MGDSTSRKEAIAAAALALFAEQGYAAAGTGEIARRAGVAQDTAFYHFGSKEGILEYILAGITDDLLEAYRDELAAAADGIAAVLAMLASNRRFSAERKLESMVLLRDPPADMLSRESSIQARLEVFLPEVCGLLRVTLAQGVADASIRPLAAPAVSWILHSFTCGIVQNTFFGPPRPAETEAEIAAFLRHALMASSPHHLPITGERE
ncbi:MAG: TetR/AcrR family transcriptional regulator [Deltaproteobacteria bacterium]|nr:TetR/AcrR family transcriptional regulator [Candidatus Anaeroferrophillacea bacterium]